MLTEKDDRLLGYTHDYINMEPGISFLVPCWKVLHYGCLWSGYYINNKLLGLFKPFYFFKEVYKEFFFFKHFINIVKLLLRHLKD